MLSLADVRHSRHLLYCTFRDAGFEPGRCARAVNVLLDAGPESAPADVEEYAPTDEDWADYVAWSDRQEAIQALRAADEAKDRRETMEVIYRSDRDRLMGMEGGR